MYQTEKTNHGLAGFIIILLSFLEKELDTKQNHNFLGARKFRCL